MLVKRYAFPVTRYNYFAWGPDQHHQETDWDEYTNPIDVIKAWKESKAEDYTYDDAWRKTGEIRFRWAYQKEYVNRRHARTEREWNRILDLRAKPRPDDIEYHKYLQDILRELDENPFDDENVML